MSRPTPARSPYFAVSRRLLLGVMIVTITLVQPRLTSGAEDAGTLSPFAQGAGGRAMGMAGAFVACADDASALIWNPGGLARVTRFALVADYARLESADTGERFAALVMPSWRWGALGIAMRQLGVGGIDARDDRNVALPGELSASETEFTLGYGRSLGPGIGLGGTVKLQRSDVGRFTGTGYGADVGLSLEARGLLGDRASWAAPLSMGLVVRNALEPAQRLDQESVLDPRLLRLGVAWHRDLSGPIGLTVATGLQQAASLPARFDLGTELSLGGGLALRSGLQAGHLAAGTSVRLAGLSVDYAYEERDLGSVQRVGISKGFGPSVSESQAAARLAQERALAERLDQAYERRLAEQVTGLFARAEQAQAAGRLDEALDAVTAARALAPQDARGARLEAALQRADGERLLRSGDPAGSALSFGRALEAWPGDSLAAAGRRRAQAELAQQANRSKHAAQLDPAYQLLASGDLVGARGVLRRLHGVTPTDSTATALLDRVERLLGERVAAGLGRTRVDIEAGRFDDAERDLDAARALGAAESDLSALRNALAFERRRAREPQASVATPAPRAPPLATSSEADRREADRQFRRGLQLASAGQADQAMRFWELALTLDPAHSGARRALEREYLLRGMSAFGRGRFTEAEAHWSRAVQLDPSDVRARTYLERARTQLERTRELTGSGP